MTKFIMLTGAVLFALFITNEFGLFKSKEIPEPKEALALDGSKLTEAFQGATYVHTGSFECPYYRTYQKKGTDVHIMPPDTIKRHPLILSDWKVCVRTQHKETRYRQGDSIPLEIEKLFWFKK